MRRYLKRPRWLVVVTLLALVAAACTSATEETTTTSGGDDGETTTSTTAGGDGGDGDAEKPQIVAALSDTPNVVEPHTFRSTSAYAVTKALYQPLIELAVEEGPDGMYVGTYGEDRGAGAESFEVTETDDGLLGTFHLREDALFSDGSPVTADDYKYAFDRTMLAEHSYITALLPLIGISSPDQVRVVDDYTLEVETDAKSPLFERFMTFQVFGAINQEVVEENATTDDPWGATYLTTNAAGSGAYILESFDPDREVVLVPNPNYWDADSLLNSGVTIRTVPDANQRALLVQRGEVDIVAGIPPKLLAELEDDPNVSIISRPTTGVHYLGMNQEIAPLDNVDVRRAIMLAVPYDALIEQVMFGYATPAQGVVTSTMATHDPEIGQQYAQDLDAAAAALEASGVGEVNLVLGVRESAGTDQEAAVLIQDALRQGGITVEVEIIPDADFAARLNAGELPLFIHDWFSWGEDPFYQMTFLTQCGSFVNYARFCNEEYDSLVEEGKFTLDAEERQEVSSRTQEIFFENAVWAPLWSTDRTLVTGKCVTGLDAEYTNVPGFTHVTKTEDC
ncbi:MAG TPA: ABC transporter substrate-binding protein [Acidimicrobiia bacterium]